MLLRQRHKLPAYSTSSIGSFDRDAFIHIVHYRHLAERTDIFSIKAIDHIDTVGLQIQMILFLFYCTESRKFRSKSIVNVLSWPGCCMLQSCHFPALTSVET